MASATKMIMPPISMSTQAVMSHAAILDLRFACAPSLLSICVLDWHAKKAVSGPSIQLQQHIMVHNPNPIDHLLRSRML